MNCFLSSYFDFLRVLAALSVLSAHAYYNFAALSISDGSLKRSISLLNTGHLAVMLFFVLSGYLISLNANRPGNSWKRYAADRITRLYTVIIPALILTAVAGFIVIHFHPEALKGALANNHQLLRYFINLLNLQQIWDLCTNPGINTPFWSLGYEFWYYVFLGLVVFSRGMKRLISLVIVGLIIGPKVLMLLPAWWFGVLAYRMASQNLRVSSRRFIIIEILGFLITSLLLLVFMLHPLWVPYWNKRLGTFPWFYSWNALADSFFAFIVAMNFYFGFRIGELWKNFNSRVLLVFSWLSKRTFSVYLYHAPIVFMITWLIPYDRKSMTQVTLLSFFVLFGCIILAQITELQTSRVRKLVLAEFPKLR